MNKPTVRVAGYVRVSTVDQLRGFGQDMQINALRQHVASRRHEGWLLPEDGLFVEQESGANAERPVLASLMKRVRAREFDIVLVWKLDRISRSLGDMLRIQWQLSECGASLASMKESLDFSSPSGRLVFHIFGALAEFERETIQMRTMEGKRASALAGNYVGPMVPFGYRKAPNPGGRGSQLEVNEAEARWVRQVFIWYTRDCLTFTQIASRLSTLGVPKGEQLPEKRRQSRWHDSTVRRLLCKEIYTGRYVANRDICRRDGTRGTRPQEQWIESQVPAIITRETFDLAQRRMHHGPDARGGGSQPYLLARKLVDPATGKRFAGYRSAKGTLNYRRPKVTSSDGTMHRSVSIAAHLVDDFTWHSLRDALAEPDSFLDALKARDAGASRDAQLKAELSDLRTALDEAERRCVRVEDDYYNGRISCEKRDHLLTRFQASQHEAAKLVAEAEARQSAHSKIQAAEDLRNAAVEFQPRLDVLDDPGRARLVKHFVDRVEIEQAGTKRIATCYLRFDRAPDDFENSLCRTQKGLPEAEEDSFVSESCDTGGSHRFGDQTTSTSRTEKPQQKAHETSPSQRTAYDQFDDITPSYEPFMFTTSTVLARRSEKTGRWVPVRCAAPRWSRRGRFKLRPYDAERFRRRLHRLLSRALHSGHDNY